MKIDFENLTSKQTEELNGKARALLVEYTEFINAYSRKYGREKYWWCLPVVCRNLAASNVFRQLCRLLLAIDYVEKDSSIHKIRVHSREEKQCLERYLKTSGSAIKVYCRNKGYFLDFKIVVGSILGYLRNFIGSYIAIKTVLRKKDIPKDRPINLVGTPVLSSCVEEGGYRDRYFNDIHELSGEELYFFPCSMLINDGTNITEFARKLQDVKNYNFILKEQFLKIYDYFGILAYWGYCLKNLKRNFQFQELDITPLVRRAMLRSVGSITSWGGILDDRALYRMKKSGIDIRNFIIWYEGRPADVQDVKSYKRYYPNGNCVAYEGFPFDELDMALVPLKEMIVQRMAADIYTVPGEAYIKIIKKYGSKANYMTVPILRNKYVVKKHVMGRKPKKILFVLSYYREFTINQIKYANIIAKKYGDNVKIILKNHPTNICDKAEDILHDKLYFKPEYAVGCLGDCLEHVDVAVVEGTTSALEVLYASERLIIVMPRGEVAMTWVPCDLDREMYSVAYSEEQFMESISEILNMEGEQYNESIERLLEPKTSAGIRKMFR